MDGITVPEINNSGTKKRDSGNKLSKEERESIESASETSDDDDDDSGSGSDESGSGSDDEYDSESSSEFEEDEEEADQDIADSEAIGIDLTRFTKKTEFNYYVDKIKDRIDGLVEHIDKLEAQLAAQVKSKGEEYSKGITIIEGRINEQMDPVREDMQTLLKTRTRQVADDIIKQNAVVERFNAIRNEFERIVQTVDYTLCPIVSCLFEHQTI